MFRLCTFKFRLGLKCPAYFNVPMQSRPTGRAVGLLWQLEMRGVCKKRKIKTIIQNDATCQKRQ